MTIIDRSAVNWWREHIPKCNWGKPPKKCHHYVRESPFEDFKMITWDDIINERRKKQRAIMSWIRRSENFRIYAVIVFWYPGINEIFFRGWHVYLKGIKESFDYKDIHQLHSILQQKFPIVLKLYEDKREQCNFWKEEFAKRYKRKLWNGKPMGIQYVHYNHYTTEMDAI